jgi:hypothetical protein
VSSLRQRAESLVVREVCDGMLLLDMDAGKIHQLNATAGFIWRQIDGVASAADIAVMVAREYGVEERAAASDVEKALSDLRKLNLIVQA